MATGRMMAGRQARRGRSKWEVSDRTKKVLIIGASGLLVLIGAWWAVDILVAPAKPDVAVAPVEQVAEFLGNPRGFARMPIERREQFLVDVVQSCNTPERVQSMSKALSQMSFTERQQFLDGTFEIVKDKFVRASDEYVRTPRAKRGQYVNQVIKNFEGLRTRLAGPAPAAAAPRGTAGHAGPAARTDGPVATLASPFQDHIPQKSDALTKMVVDRTTPSERAKVKPLADDILQELDRRKQQAKINFQDGR